MRRSDILRRRLSNDIQCGVALNYKLRLPTPTPTRPETSADQIPPELYQTEEHITERIFKKKKKRIRGIFFSDLQFCPLSYYYYYKYILERVYTKTYCRFLLFFFFWSEPKYQVGRTWTWFETSKHGIVGIYRLDRCVCVRKLNHVHDDYIDIKIVVSKKVESVYTN